MFVLDESSDKEEQVLHTLLSGFTVFANVMFLFFLAFVLARQLLREKRDGSSSGKGKTTENSDKGRCEGESDNGEGSSGQRRARSNIPRSVVVPAAASHAHVYAALKMQSQVRSAMLKQQADAKQKNRGGSGRLKRQDTADTADTAAVAKLVVKTASEHAQAKKKHLQGMRRSSLSRLNSRLEKRKSRAKKILLPAIVNTREAPGKATVSAQAAVPKKPAVAARRRKRLEEMMDEKSSDEEESRTRSRSSTATAANKATSNIDPQSIEIVRLQLAKKMGNSKKLAGIILKLNKPEKSLKLPKQKFLKLIKKMIEHSPKIHSKITPTKNLFDAVWDQARNHPNSENKNNDVIGIDRLDKWLFSEM
jgi:hypothetical protein